MKARWQIKTLGEVLERTETVNPLQSPDTEFDYIDVSSVSNTTFEVEQTQRLMGKDAPSRARKLVKTNDVLFATIRPTLRRIAIVPPHLNQQVCSTGYFVLRPKAALDHRYMYYWLFAEEFMGQMEALQKGASYPAVTDKEVRDQVIPYPPLPEQQRIVTLLDEAFGGIATAKAHAEKNLQNARAIFESHLQSVFTQRGDGWAQQTLGDTYDVRDGTHDSPKYHDKGFPLITSKNLKRDGLNFDDVRLIEAADYRKINERSAVHKGDVLLAMIGTIGNPVVVEMEPNFAIKNVALLKVPAEQHSHFLRYYLSSQFVVDKMQSEAKGTTQKFVGLGYLRSFPIMVPSGAQQAEVVGALDELSSETNRLESIYQRKLTALNELKKSLLHRAFNGDL
jgi:type I restriction enzyme S subunit